MMNYNIDTNSSSDITTKDISLNDNKTYTNSKFLSKYEYKPLLIDRIFSSKKICDSVIMHYNTTIFYIHRNILSFNDNDKICINKADISYNCIGSDSPLTFNFNNSSYEGNLVEPPECILNFGTHFNKEISDFLLHYNETAGRISSIADLIVIDDKQKATYDAAISVGETILEGVQIIKSIIKDSSNIYISDLLNSIINVLIALNKTSELKGETSSSPTDINSFAQISADIAKNVADKIILLDSSSSNPEIKFYLSNINSLYSKIQDLIDNTTVNPTVSNFVILLSNVNELIYNSFLIYHTAFYDDIFSKDNSSNKSLLLITQGLFFFTGAIKRTAITPHTNLTIKNARTLLISGLESIKAAINFHDYSLKLYRKFSSVVHTKKCNNEEGPTSSFFYQTINSIIAGNLEITIHGTIGEIPFTATTLLNPIKFLANINFSFINMVTDLCIPKNKSYFKINETLDPILHIKAIVPQYNYSSYIPAQIRANVILQLDFNVLIEIIDTIPKVILTSK